MERPGPKTKLVRFGLFEADLNGRSLNKDGLRIRIQEQPFQILVLLLERPGEVVTRESIRQQLWPADTYVAFDDGLNTAMKKLRLALGDSSDNPRFIETIPRRGYRFLASPVFVDPSPKRTPVLSDIDAIAREPRLANTIGGVAPEPFAPETVMPGPAPNARSRPIMMAGVVVAAVSLVAIAVWITSTLERHSRLPAASKLPSQDTRPGQKRMLSPRAHEEFLQARNYWKQRTAEALSKAVDHYNLAIELDPNYAEAYAGLANCYVVMPLLSTVPIETSYTKARGSAARAVQLDDSVAQAHLAAAEVDFYGDWDFVAAEKEFARAIELDAIDAQAHQWYAEFLSITGRHREAIAQIHIAEQLDPSSMIIHHQAGQVFREARMYPEALEEYRTALMMQPGFGPTYAAIGVVYRRQERYRESLEALEQANLYWDPGGTAVQDLQRIAASYAASGKPALFRGLLQYDQKHKGPAYDSAILHALIRNDAQTLQLLEKALADRRPEILNIGNDPEFDSLRTNPHFQEIVKAVGLPITTSGENLEPPREKT